MTPNNGSPDLSVIPDLQRITRDGQQALIAIARVLHLTTGSVLLYQGDVIHSFYLIQQGGVRLVEYMPDGQSVSLKIYGPGDVFGLLAISGSYPHATQIETIHDSTLLAFSGEETRRLMLVYPDIALFVIDRLTAHIHEAHHRLRAMAVERVERRLARALLHLSLIHI
jgi:CRP-like cAMP-binding protein